NRSAVGLRIVVGERLIHLGDVPHPGGDDGRALVHLLGDHFVEGVGLRVVRLAVVGGGLLGEVSGDAGALEGDVVGGAEVLGGDGVEVENLFERLVDGGEFGERLVEVFQRDGLDAAGSGVVHQHGIHLGDFTLVVAQ